MENMTELEGLLPVVAVETPGASDAVREQYLSLAAREFCEQTEIWVEELWPINVYDGRTEYDLDLDEDDVEIVGVAEAKHNTLPMTPGVDYTVNELNALVLEAEPASDQSAALVVKVVCRPTLFGTRVVDWLYRDWGVKIASGAIAKMAASPKKPWSNVAVAQMFGGDFAAAVAEARVQKTRGHRQRRTPVATLRRFC